mgnify:CR=1 FL=1
MKRDVLFFWIPKNAGTSIYKVLKEYDCPKLKHLYLSKTFDNSGYVTFSHISINYLLERNIISKKYFNDAYKFCFVRNPWDRLVSIYHYRNYDENITFSEFIHLIQKKFQLQQSFLGKLSQNFYNTLFFMSDGPSPITGKLTEISKKIDTLPSRDFLILPLPRVGPYNVLGLSQANPQSDWIYDKNGNLMVDFIGKVENLNEDIDKVFEIIGINGKIPHLNKTKRKKYKKYYTEETKKIVEGLYKKDIENFGYTF